MKIFVFLLIFCLAILSITFINPEHYLGTETYGVNSLTLLKNSAFGAIRLFGLVFCVMATALIIPKDIEDRILYTILCKPVHRIDYLLGKALGVIALAAAAILIMDLFTSAMLLWRGDALVSRTEEAMRASGYAAEQIQSTIAYIRSYGLNWNFQAGMLILVMECVVLTSLTLLLSCLTSGTIISSLLTFCIYIVGLFQTQAKLLWLGTPGEGISRMEMLGSQVFTLIFPNFGLYSITDNVLAGVAVPWSILGQLAIVTMAYLAFHAMLSAWIFRNKEF